MCTYYLLYRCVNTIYLRLVIPTPVDPSCIEEILELGGALLKGFHQHTPILEAFGALLNDVFNHTLNQQTNKFVVFFFNNFVFFNIFKQQNCWGSQPKTKPGTLKTWKWSVFFLKFQAAKMGWKGHNSVTSSKHSSPNPLHWLRSCVLHKSPFDNFYRLVVTHRYFKVTHLYSCETRHSNTKRPFHLWWPEIRRTRPGQTRCDLGSLPQRCTVSISMSPPCLAEGTPVLLDFTGVIALRKRMGSNEIKWAHKTAWVQSHEKMTGQSWWMLAAPKRGKVFTCLAWLLFSRTTSAARSVK